MVKTTEPLNNVTISLLVIIQGTPLPQSDDLSSSYMTPNISEEKLSDICNYSFRNWTKEDEMLLNKVRCFYNDIILKDKEDNLQMLERFYKFIRQNVKAEKKNCQTNVKEFEESMVNNDLKILKLRFIKLLACRLKYSDNFSNQKILKILPLSKNQLKNAIQKYRSVGLKDITKENRGAHMKVKSKRSAHLIKEVRSLIIGRDNSFTLAEILRELKKRNENLELSQSTIYNILKKDLKMKFGFTKKYLKTRSSNKNKAYTLYVAETILKYFSEKKIVVSIDETGFSSYMDRKKFWYFKDRPYELKQHRKQVLVSFSLLLAVCNDEIIGYYLIEGSVNAIIFLSFLMRVIDYLDSTYPYRNKLIVMDNVKFHRSLIVKKYMESIKFYYYFLFTPNYVPELNYVEYLFQRIKKRMRTKGFCKSK